ncbi:MAG: hypothetical protein JHD32_00790 [Sphingobium sp.]|nr:hypothetical protein [Sphingobium sp.]
MNLDPALLFATARDERARRKEAWKAAGQGLSDRAAWDDVVWSNIEQRTGLAAADPAFRQRQPQCWYPPAMIMMARSAWATAVKAESSLDATDPANAAKITALWTLFRWLKPAGWSPYFEAKA